MDIHEATFYNWKKKYGGLGVSELRRLKALEEENRQLKQLVADLSLDKQMLQDVLKKSSNSHSKKIYSRQPNCRLLHINQKSLLYYNVKHISVLL